MFSKYLYSFRLGKRPTCVIENWERWGTSKFGPWILRYVLHAGARKDHDCLIFSNYDHVTIFPNLDTSQCVQMSCLEAAHPTVWNLCSPRWNMTHIHVGLCKMGRRNFFTIWKVAFLNSKSLKHPGEMGHTPCSIKRWSWFGPRKVGKLLRDNQEKLDPNEAGLAVGT